MSTKELAARIGKRALWSTDKGASFAVEILDASISYGIVTYTVKPVSGIGQFRTRSLLDIGMVE